jgi:hypothetical protein
VAGPASRRLLTESHTPHAPTDIARALGLWCVHEERASRTFHEPFVASPSDPLHLHMSIKDLTRTHVTDRAGAGTARFSLMMAARFRHGSYATATLTLPPRPKKTPRLAPGFSVAARRSLAAHCLVD